VASPQKERGYTPIAHEILDEISHCAFNGAQFCIIMKIWRMTYGFQRKDHKFSIEFLQLSTGLSERAVKKEVKALIAADVLIVTKKSSRTASRRMSFNKNYDEWSIRKRGGPVEKQLDLFSSDEVHDCSPNNGEDQVHDCSPNEVHDCSPNSNENHYFEVHDCSPMKERRSLKKKIFKENVDLFEQFYSVYPRKISKQAAYKAWQKLEKEASFDPAQVIQNTLNFAETHRMLGTEVRFIPHPSTYLNQKRFIDYPVVDPEGIATQHLTPRQRRNQEQDDILRRLYEEGVREDEEARGGAAAVDYQNRLPQFRGE
jgi:phage replication O-like protein O